MTTYRSLRSLRDQARQVQPDPAWVRTARQTLLMQAKNAMPTEEIAARDREPLIVALFNRTVETVRGPVLAAMSVAVVVLGGSIASVSASDESLPGDVLYPVKLVTEQARLVFTPTSGKVRLKGEFTQRRVNELKAVAADTADPKKDERVGKAADALKSDLDTLRRQLSDVQEKSNAGNTAEAAKIVDKQAVEVAKTLSETTEGLSPETKEKVNAAKAQAVDVGIRALEVLVESNGASGGDGISDADIAASVIAHTEIARETVANAKASVTLNASSTQLSIMIPVNQSSSTKSATSTTALQLVQDSEASLATLQGLLEGKQFDQVVNVLKDATLKSLTVQKQVAQQDTAVDAVPEPAASASSSVLGSTTASSTVPTSTPPAASSTLP